MAVAGGSVASTSLAAERQWLGADGDAWSTATVWSAPGAPGPGDSVLFSGGTGISIVDDDFSVTAVTYASGSTVELSLEGAGIVLALTGGGIVNTTGGSPAVVIAASGGGTMRFEGTSSAADAGFTVWGESSFGEAGALHFTGGSSAGSALIAAFGGEAPGAAGAEVVFADGSTAGTAEISLGGGSAGGEGARALFTGSGSAAEATLFGESGASVDISATTGGTSIGALEGSPSVELGTRTLTVGAVTPTEAFSGVISGSGGLTKTGASTLTLAGVNAFTGQTTVQAGTLQLQSLTTNGALQGSVVVDGGTLRHAVSEQIADTASVTLESGTFDLNERSETVAAFTNNGGNFTTGEGGSLTGTGNTVTWAGGTNTIAAGGTVQDSHVVISGGVNVVEQGAVTGGRLEVVSGPGSGLSFEGTGSPTISLEASNNDPGKISLANNVSVTSAGTATIASTGTGATAGTVDLQGGNRTFTVADGAQAVDLLVSAAVDNGSLTKEGAGTMRLTGSSPLTGSVTVAAGALEVHGAGANVLPAVSGIQVTGGTLLLSGADGRIGDGVPLTLAEGSISFAGASLSETVGTLSMLSSSAINFGSGGATLLFAAVNATGWSGTLQVLNWTTGQDSLLFTTPGGLDAGQLALVQFYSDGGSIPIGSGAKFSGNELVPQLAAVPEPAAVAWLALCAGVVSWRDRRRRRHVADT